MAVDANRAFVVDGVFYRVPEQSILQGVYLKMRPGQICGLFGLNGSGKSTVLRVAAGQLQPSSGLTIIDGTRFHKPLRRRRFQHIAYLPQDSMLPGDLRVRSLLKTLPDRGRALRTDSIVEPLLDRRVEELSGGERRYVATRFVLRLGRPYVLLDEPFTGVEPRIVDRLVQHITAAAAAGAGVLITDHYHQYLLPLVDTAYLMRQKQCEPLGTGDDVLVELERFGYLSKKQAERHSTSP